MDGNSSSLVPYTFVNNCSESNRQSGHPGNNYGGCSFYGGINCLVQGCSINQSGLAMDGAYYYKSDVENGCMRGNFVSVSNCTHAFDYGQSPNALTKNSETCFNILISPGGGGIFLPQTGGFNYGTLWCYRNNVIGSPGFASNQATSDGPTRSIPMSRKAAECPLGCQLKRMDSMWSPRSGALSATTGQLTGTYRTEIPGTIGAEIALISSALTPKAPSLSVT